MRVRLAAVFKEVFGMTTEQNESQTTSDELELAKRARETEPPEPPELELERARELVASRPADAVRIAYDRGYNEGVRKQRGEQERERVVNELAEDARPRERVRLKGGHPFSAPMLGTIVDVGRKGAVVDWDSGLRNYVEFAALEPQDEPDPIELAAWRVGGQ
jgi:hypothetical protein